MPNSNDIVEHQIDGRPSILPYDHPLGVLWDQLFCSHIAPFLFPRDLCQLALTSRALHRQVARPQTWKCATVAFFGIADDAALALEQMYETLCREEGVGPLAGAEVLAQTTCESSVRTLTVRRCESHSREASPEQNVWMLEDAATSWRLGAQETVPHVDVDAERTAPMLLHFTPMSCDDAGSCADGDEEENGKNDGEGCSGDSCRRPFHSPSGACVGPHGSRRTAHCSADAPHAAINTDISTSTDTDTNTDISTHTDTDTGINTDIGTNTDTGTDINTDAGARVPFPVAQCAPWSSPRAVWCCESLLVCAATMARMTQPTAGPFPWRAYCRMLYEHRVGAFLRMLSHPPGAAAAARYTRLVDAVLESGCALSGAGAGPGALVAAALCRELRSRANIRFALGSADGAVADLCLAHLLDGDKRAGACLPALLRGAKAPAGRSLERAYARVAGGGVFCRAVFLQRWLVCRGPSALVYLLQYALCDEIGHAAPHLLQRAALCAAPGSRDALLVRAWRACARGHHEAAVSDAELAAAMLPRPAWRSAEAFAQALRGAEAPNGGLGSDGSGESDGGGGLSLRHAGRGGLKGAVPDGAAFAFETLARAAAAAGLSGVAADALARASALRPSAPLRAAALCAAAAECGGPDSAAPRLLRLARRVDPQWFPAHRATARLEAAAGDPQAACETLSRAIAAGRPAPAAAFVERIRCRRRDPVPDADEATARDPRLSYPYQVRAAVLMDTGHCEEAIAELGRIIALTANPNDVALRLRFRLDEGRTEGVLEDLALLALLAPKKEKYREWFLRAAEIFPAGGGGQIAPRGARLAAWHSALGMWHS